MSAETPEEERVMVAAYHRLVPAGGEHEDAQIIAFMRGWAAGRDWSKQKATQHQQQQQASALPGRGEGDA